MLTLNQYRGCLLGLATGDALGAPFEGGVPERLAWRAIGRCAEGQRWSDDTQMSIDLAESFLANRGIDQDALVRRFATSYHWSRGYGPGAARLLKRVAKGMPWQEATRSVYPDGSFGNGGAMRAPVLALLLPDDDDARDDAARRAAEVTHAHPLGIDGAIVLAAATSGFLRRHGDATILADVSSRCTTALSEKLDLIGGLLAVGVEGPDEVVDTLGNGITALTSCATALYVALRFRTVAFDTMLRFVIDCGG
ncbi:MAG: poly(ADP-ribose) glycohydrolase ARH3, partial [Myxococcota bacterium]